MAGAAGLASACEPDFEASVPHPARRRAGARTCSENFSSSLHPRAGRTRKPPLKKDGAPTASLAHVQSPGEIFSIRDFQPRCAISKSAEAFHPSPVRHAHPAVTACPGPVHSTPATIILTVGRPWWKDRACSACLTLEWLALGRDGVQTGFKVFLSFGPKFAALHRQSLLDGFHPVE